MPSRSVIVVTAAILVPVSIIAIVLGVLLSSNNGKPDDDAGYAIANVPNIGRLRGMLTNESSAIFYGIPFSQTTEGEHRWRKPRDPLPVEDDTATVDASTKPMACPQFCDFPSPEISCPLRTEMSEDCLNLNIFVPSSLLAQEASYHVLRTDLKPKPSPVLVFIHGGAFIAGGNGVPLYDARYLAEKGDIIVVTLNYRLGPFGFFYQNNGTDDPALGNFGIYDQMKGLEWVQRHIADFGGDPNEVTVFGQSAGAQSIAILLLTEAAEPLFQRAIMESNPFGLPYKHRVDAQSIADNFAEFANCTPNDMQCLKSLTIDDILYVYKELPYRDLFNAKHISHIFEPWSPIIDDVLLTDYPMNLFNQGLNQDKPMIIGYVADEGAMFIEEVFTDPVTSPLAYKMSARILFRNHSDAVLERYPPQCRIGNTDCDERFAMNPAITDYTFTCPGRRATNSDRVRGNADAKIWWYMFEQVWSFPDFWDFLSMCYTLVCHTAEIPYLFDIDDLTDYRFTPNEEKLAERMRTFWVNFAKYGDPNGPGMSVSKKMSPQAKAGELVYWPRYFEQDVDDPTASYRLLHFSASGDEIINNFKKDDCDFFDGLDYYLENYRIGEERKSVFEQWISMKDDILR